MDDRPGAASRRAGYVIGVVVNAALLVLIHWWPAVPFLTGATRQVLLAVTVLLVLNLATSVAFLAYDRTWFVAAGRLVAGAAGLVATVRVLQVFPFDFGASGGWTTATRVVLTLAAVGGALGVVTQLVVLLRQGLRPR